MPESPPFIVAEVSKNWERTSAETPAPPAAEFVCAKFEEIINYNRHRGYRLHSFQLHRMVTSPGVMNETIIAVFERAPA